MQNLNGIKIVVGAVTYFGAYAAVGGAVFSVVRGTHPALQVAGFLGSMGLGMAAGDVARAKMVSTIEQLENV